MKKLNILILLSLSIILVSSYATSDILFPYNMSVEAGTKISGTIQDMYYADGLLIIGDESDGTVPATDFRIYFKDVENISNVHFNYIFDEDHNTHLEIFNYSSSNWDDITTLAKSNTLISISLPLEPNTKTVSDYTNGGDLIIRIYSYRTGTAGNYKKYFLNDLFVLVGDSLGSGSEPVLNERNLNDGESYDYLNYGNGLIQGKSYLGVNSIIPYTFPMSNPSFMPLVADVDNDDSLDIIVMNEENLLVLENKTLNLKYSFVTKASYNPKIYVYDIDGDNDKEIIVYGDKTGEIQIIGYDNNLNELVLEKELPPPRGGVSGNTVLACYEPNRCSIFYGFADTSNTNTYYFYQRPFNSTGYTHSQYLVKDIYKTQSIGCISMLPSMEAEDLDNDGNPEYVVSVTTEGESLGGTNYVLVYNDNSTGTKWSFSKNHYDTVNGVDLICSNVIQRTISSPIVGELDLSHNGLETVVAMHGSNDEEFKVYLLDSQGNEIENFPEIYNAEGKIISNLVQTDVFDNTGVNDVCIMGYNDNTNVLDLFCIMTRSMLKVNNYEYGYKMDFTITDDYNIIIHSLQAKTQSPHDRMEFSTPYGIFETDGGTKTSEGNIPDNDLNLLVSFESGDSVYLPVEYEGDGYIDMLALTPSGLFYLDDGFTNTAPIIEDEVIINPCGVEQYIGFNEDVTVSAKVTDINNNDVAMRIQMYLNTDHELDTGFSQFYLSGSTISQTLTMPNQTGLTDLIITVKDDYLGDSKETQYIIPMLGVKENGSQYGDCVSYYGVVNEETPENPYNQSTSNLKNNIISKTLNPVGGYLGLSLALVYLIFLGGLVIYLSLFIFNLTHDKLVTGGSAVILGILGLFVGVSLNIIGVGIIIILVIIGLIPIALTTRKVISGG